MLRRFIPAFYFLGAVVLTVSCLLHQSKGNGLDFFAYYKAAHRALAGQPFYVDEPDYAFKYAPITLLYFLPFASLPYEAARWFYAVLHCLVSLCIPLLLWRLFQSDPISRRSRATTLAFPGFLLAFCASFRFIDGEFRDSNVGLFIALALLTGTWLLRKESMRRYAPLVIALGSVVKVHSLLSFFAFDFRKSRPTQAALLFATGVLIFVPSPFLWFQWWEQLQKTGRFATFSMENYTLQGFYPFAAHFLGMNPLSHSCLALALPFAIAAWVGLPKFSLDEAAERPAVFFLTLGIWVLLAIQSSPLPWQHTYSFLWALLPLSWWVSNNAEKKGLIALSAFLALTPRDIIGRQAFAFLESRQSVFLAILSLWVLLLVQVRRLNQDSLHEQS